MSESQHKHISKTLSYWLRHAPEAADLLLDSAGWADVEAVLAAFESAQIRVERSALHQVVVQSDKQRFEMSVDGDRIRARQGHSVQVEADWIQSSPPTSLYHGTTERVSERISREGLKPGSRHHVHLSADIETAKIVGMRRGVPIIFEIAAGALAEEGEPFFLSSNGVWLVGHVPPKHLTMLPAG